jgi:hypothetical protein
MEIEFWNGTVSTPTLALPLQGGGDVEADACFGLTEWHEDLTYPFSIFAIFLACRAEFLATLRIDPGFQPPSLSEKLFD